MLDKLSPTQRIVISSGRRNTSETFLKIVVAVVDSDVERVDTFQAVAEILGCATEDRC